jgi:amino acid adenylation domain-containing protein
MSKPEEALLAKLNKLSPAQRDALLKKLQAQKAKVATPVSDNIVAVPREKTHYPLSFAQQRLWFLEQMSDSHASYNIAAAFQLTGVIDTQALNNTFCYLIKRHESLRTVFIATNDGPQQQIKDTIDWQLEITDLNISHTLLTELIHQQANVRFDLEHGPLFNIQLFKQSAEEHTLTIVLHHIISDAWSSQLLLNEAAQVYQQLIDGQQAFLPPLAIQYIDYTLWQNAFLEKPAAEKQIEYWKAQLNDFNNLHLPTDKQRPAVTTYNGSFERITINQNLKVTLDKYCKDHHLTLFSILLAAYEVFLYRYTQQTDFCIGIPIANRHHSDSEGIMGFFVNSLAMRCDISEGGTLLTVAKKIQHRVIEAQNQQDIPFEKLVTALPTLERNHSINPIFQTFFSLTQDNVHHGFKLGNANASYIPADIDGTKFDLSLSLRESHNSISCHFEYNQDLFYASTIKNMARHFITLLEVLCQNIHQSIEKCPFLTAEEYQQQMNCDKGWNATKTSPSLYNSLHEIFEQQVEKTSSAIAVSDDSHALSYTELNHKANQLAHYLISLGIKANSPVAVCLERGVEMSIALLAILKAGGAYVPIATDTPKERLAFICNDTKARIIISTHAITLDNSVIQNIVISNNDSWQQQPNTNPKIQRNEDEIFNIIYTSGSTGKPKGVMVPHRGIINRLEWMQQQYPLNSNDIVLQKTPYNFDVSVWELFWPLITGSRLFYAKHDGHKDPEYLRDIIQQQNISILHFVPSMLGVFLDTKNIQLCTSIKKVFTSGEALQLNHNQRFFELLPNTELHNLYGPTEASIDVSYYQCHPNEKNRSIPIGKPISNTQLHILDSHLQPLPIGAAGELYIGGTGLALGYINQTELTNNTFIDNPYFALGHPSKKLYKTGDVARYLSDGNIEYLGRNDHQVKIRGFRIELGEIESQLRNIDNVKEAIVVSKNINGQDQLVAYIYSEAPLLENAAYAALLQKHLPEYMLPAAYCAISEVPLSANGKIDRKHLPDINFSELKQYQYVAPRNTTESTLANIWQQLLNIEKVGVLDNFFELGGHSLLAAQMLTRIRDSFSVQLPLRTLFEINTIAGLSEIISAMSPSYTPEGEGEGDDDDFEEGVL